jgi:hypothetical protein
MAADVTIMALPSFAGGDGAGRPQILLQRDGVWCNLSTRDPIDLSTSRREVGQGLNGLMARVVKHPAEAPWPKLFTIGFVELYQRLVPPPLREILKAAAATAVGDDMPILRIHTADAIDWIPWELMHDGIGFLGLRFQVVRLPIVPTIPDPLHNQPYTVQRIYNLLAEHLFSDQVLFEQWKTTFSNLVAHANQEIRRPSTDGGGNNYPSLMDLQSAQNPDIVHITCHGGEKDKEDGRIFWTLNDKHAAVDSYRLKANYVQFLKQTAFFANTRPLIFGNACSSVKATVGAESPAEGDLVHGFGPAFMAQGAIAFVGTFVAISKQLSVEFACEFYSKLLGENLPIGKAMWATKQHFHQQGGNDPSWLFYCLYGLPETCFQIAQ